jgi:hypothetical protein
MKKSIWRFALTILHASVLLVSCKKNADLKTPGLKLPDVQASSPGAGDAKYDLLGFGYNVTGQLGHHESSGYPVLDINKLDLENPTLILESSPRETFYKEEYAENAESYSQKISNSIEATSEFNAFGQTISSGFSHYNRSTYMFDYKYIYGSYDLVIRQKRFRLSSGVSLLQNYLTQGFWNDLTALTPEEIITKYGTHVLLDLYTGAKLSIMFEAETSNTNKAEAARVGINAGIGKIFSIHTNYSYEDSLVNKNFFRKLSYRTMGGDPSKYLIGQLDLDDQNSPAINIGSWQSSSTPENSLLVEIAPNGLLPLYELVADPVKKETLRNAINSYITARQVKNFYTPSPVYSFYNGRFHYLSTSRTGAPAGYTLEGITFLAFTYPVPGSTNIFPIYRWQDTSDGSYIYVEANYQLPSEYVNQGIAFYAQLNDVPPARPLYRYYNSRSGDHYFVTDFNMLGNGGSGGYKLDGLCYWVW